jgi:hypothetical protein
MVDGVAKSGVLETLDGALYLPNTQGKTLEEIALVFGDDDLVVVRQEDIHIDADHRITAMVHDKEAEHEVVESFEDINVSTKETI